MFTAMRNRVEDILQTQGAQNRVLQKHCEELAKKSIYSPDIIHLERTRRQTLFVMDDMMTGGQYHDLLVEKSVTGKFPISGAYTTDEFFMWKKDLGMDSFPVVLDKNVSGHYYGPALTPAKIWGEVYSIRPSLFRKLDFMKENGVVFTRRQVQIIIPRYKLIFDKKHPLPELKDANGYLDAWMYVGNHSYWDDQLAGVIPSSPVPLTEDHAREWLKKYYRYR